MKISELRNHIELELLNQLFDTEISGVFISDMISDIIAGLAPGSILVTILTDKNLIATANLVDASAIVYVSGKRPSEDTIKLGDRAKLSLLSTDLDAWNLALKLSEAGLR